MKTLSLSFVHTLLVAGGLLCGHGCELIGPVSNSETSGTIAYDDSLDYLHLIRDDGTMDRQIGTRQYMAPKWSPGGALLSAYETPGTPEVDLALVVIDPATGQTRRIATVLESDSSGKWQWVVIWQSWSPDGRYIAFSSPKVSSRERIFVVDVETGREWTIGVEGASTPTWQPSGKYLAYIPDAGNFRIVQFDGAEDVEFISGVCCAGYPQWSPKGDLVAFFLNESSNLATVLAYVGVVSTREVRPLGSPRGFIPEGWSPDGTRLLLSYQNRLAMIGSDGGDIQWLTEALYDQGVRQAFHAYWSPRGDKIAFVTLRSNPSERYDLWVIKTDGSEAKKIAEKCGSEFSWSPK